MTGHLLAQHREGLQVAELEPQTGRVVAVRDAIVDVDTVRQMVADLPRGHWLIVTALELSSPETTSTLQGLRDVRSTGSCWRYARRGLHLPPG